MLLCVSVLSDKSFYIMGTGFILFSIWSLIGYKCKWRHIYCSFQNAYHKKMTPNCVCWDEIKKSDAYVIPLIFLLLGLALLGAEILR